MPTIRFFQCIQDSQVLGTSNEHMVSQLFFAIDDKGEHTCEIHQDAGADNSFDDSPLIVKLPGELEKSFNYEDFRTAAEGYFKECVGAKASKIVITGSKNVRMKNQKFSVSRSAKVKSVGDKPSDGWSDD